jgi:hypothetical protein
VLLFLEELSSIVLTPFMLYFTLPACAGKGARQAESDCSVCRVSTARYYLSTTLGFDEYQLVPVSDRCLSMHTILSGPYFS